jgi:hypothetical protein
MMASSHHLGSSVASIFYSKSASAADNLKNATLFTRIHIRATPQAAQDALNSAPQLRNTFLFVNLSDILVFEKDKEQHETNVAAG